MEFEDELGERLAAEAQERGLPGEGAGDFLGAGGGDDDGGRGRCRGGVRGSEGDDGTLVGYEVERLDRKTRKRVGVNALHLGDGNFAFGDEDVDGGGLEIDVEGGADGADIDIAGAHDEGAGGVFGDGEMRFAAGEEDAALGGGELFDHFAAGVELDDGAVREGELARGGGRAGGGGREGRRGKCRGSREADRDEGEGCGGGERGEDERSAPEGAAAGGGGEDGRRGALGHAVEEGPGGGRVL